MRVLTARRLTRVVALAGVAALALSACGTSSENSDGSSGASGGGGSSSSKTITAAEVNEFTSFNPSTPDGNLDTNSKVLGMIRGSFFYVDKDLNVVPDKSFGTMETVSEDPLTVKYTINEGVKWSDGTPVTAQDMLLTWAANSAYFDDATTDAEGKVTKGTQYFTPAGDTTGLNATKVPTIGDDNRSLTLEYTTPYADYSLVSLGEQPLHVITKAVGLTNDDFVKAVQDTPKGDASKPAASPNEVLQKVSEFWNTKFAVTSLPSDKSLYLSSGPMMVKSWTPGQSMTFEANPDYTGDLKAKVGNIVIRFIGDAAAQVTALKNGEVNIINPQASADTLASLKDISSATTLTGDQLSYDHLDLSFNGVFADKNVREAFLKTIPRQQILESLIIPQNPNAKVYNSQLFFPGTADYDKTIADNGSSKYGDVDIEGAKALLAGQTPTVRLMYNTKNPNRVDTFQAIQASASKAGFKIVDAGSPDWSSKLGDGTYDAVVFGWISSGVGVGTLGQIFKTKGGGNYNNYSNPQVDEINAELQKTVDKDKQNELQLEADKLIFADDYGLPLFVAPGVFAFTKNVTGVEYNPTQTGVWWNFWQWDIGAA